MKITLKGTPMNTNGDLPKVGDKISFKLSNTKFEDVSIDSIKGPKVLSTFPSINTSVCDRQTREIIDLAKKHPNYKFISISLDLPPAQATWCGANNFENVLIFSDYKNRDFSKKYGLLIENIYLMHRCLIILDENNVITYIKANDEVSKDPDFKSLITNLKD